HFPWAPSQGPARAGTRPGKEGAHPNFLLFGAYRARSWAVIARMPVLIVGAGIGWYRLEWSDGSGAFVLSLSFTRARSTEPSPKMQIGILSAVRPYSLKSSPPM